MKREFSRSFVRLNWVGFVLIILVMLAGSVVRITGSGMGCPDWPTCFGKAIPPTSIEELPSNYKEIYSEKREKKLDKFIHLLQAVGLDGQAQKLNANKGNILIEQDFNAKNTWTEYINRLFGFLAGNAVLITFIWVLARYRSFRLISVSGLNLILMGLQGWFGSVVVATNLLPWTISIHLFLALVIIALQLYIIRLASPTHRQRIMLSSTMIYLLVFIFIVTFFQFFLGTQVREDIDWLKKAGVPQSQWDENFTFLFFIHRSFSWLVLGLIAWMYNYNRKYVHSPLISWTFYLLLVELLAGVSLAYLDVPGLVQTAHLLFATLIFSTLTLCLFRVKHLKSVS